MKTNSMKLTALNPASSASAMASASVERGCEDTRNSSASRWISQSASKLWASSSLRASCLRRAKCPSRARLSIPIRLRDRLRSAIASVWRDVWVFRFIVDEMGRDPLLGEMIEAPADEALLVVRLQDRDDLQGRHRTIGETNAQASGAAISGVASQLTTALSVANAERVNGPRPVTENMR